MEEGRAWGGRERELICVRQQLQLCSIGCEEEPLSLTVNALLYTHDPSAYSLAVTGNPTVNTQREGGKKYTANTGAGLRHRKSNLTHSFYSPAGTLVGGRKRSGCLRQPIGPGWTAGSAGKLYVPPCRDRGPSQTGCQTPSWCLRVAGWTFCPMGCVTSLERPPTLEYLRSERDTCQNCTLVKKKNVFCCSVLMVEESHDKRITNNVRNYSKTLGIHVAHIVGVKTTYTLLN